MEFAGYNQAQLERRKMLMDVYEAFCAAREELRQFKGELGWVKDGERDVLMCRRGSRRSTDGPIGNQPIGVRSRVTEELYAQFQASQQRLHQTRDTLLALSRRPDVLEMGSAPDLLVAILERLEAWDRSDWVRVTGAAALYAYEAAAKVRLPRHLLAPTHRGLQLAVATDCEGWDGSLVPSIPDGTAMVILGLLREADPSFLVAPDNPCAFMNRVGYRVELFRQAPLAMGVTSFVQGVIGRSGMVATMHVLHPMDFIDFKAVLATHPDRDPADRAQDLLHVEIVQELVLRHMPEHWHEQGLDWSRWRGDAESGGRATQRPSG